MIALQGYFDGNTCIPLEKSKLLPKQKVIISALDEFIDTTETKLSDFFGYISAEDSDKMLESLKDCEYIEDYNKW